MTVHDGVSTKGEPLRRALIVAELERLLGAAVPPLDVLGCCTSTQDELRRAAGAGAPHGTAVVADMQTAGRGRRGHAWYSPPSKHVYLSVLLRMDLAAAEAAAVTLALGVAVATVIDRHLDGMRAAIKWPNDIYLAGRKVAGVLVEVCEATERTTVMAAGVGLNVHTEHAEQWPPALMTRATSLARCGGRHLARETIAAELIQALLEAAGRYQVAGVSAFEADLEARDWLRGRRVRCHRLRGEACGLDSRGRLLIRRPDGGVEAVVAGEVEVT